MQRSHPGRARDSRASYLLSAAVVWATIWMGAAVVLKDSGGFADMIPLLTIGTAWFIAVVPALFAPSDRRSGSHR